MNKTKHQSPRPQAPRQGQEFNGFVVVSVDDLAEYQAWGVRLKHKASAMDVYHVLCADEENLFSFGFKTLPSDSSGVAHILEHTVLCGSERYPLKDPFVLLLKGSMNTFLNAFTFPDKTVYPASSTVAADLFNLMEVYADAVWFPLIRPEMFRQEGHRLEYDDQGVLQRTGVVYNEMKGNYSTHDAVAGDWCFRSLFPGTPYAHDSGGDPAHIPELSYEQFKEFHRTLYHPTNTLLFLYGNIPSQDYCSFLESRFLNRFDFSRLPSVLDTSKLSLEPFMSPVRHTVTFPAGADSEDAQEASVTVNWLLDSVKDPVKLLSYELLGELLIGSAASPLQRALVDSGLGEDLSSPTGLETELAQVVFCAGLRGTDQSRTTDIESLVLDTVARIADEGFDPEMIEGTLRRFEFRAREIKGGPFGLRLMRRAYRGWLHGAEPRLTLGFTDNMLAVRKALDANPRYFSDMVRSELLGNKHRSTITVVPDSEQNQREEAELRAELDAIDSRLDAAGKARIKQEQAELLAFQEAPESEEALASIPFLKKEDIHTKVRTLPHELGTIQCDGYETSHAQHEIFSNGVAYFDFVQDLGHLSPEEFALVPLFYGMIPSLGVPGLDYETMATRLSLVAGGFAAYPEVAMTFDGGISKRAFWRLRALEANLTPAWDLARQLIFSADFSNHKRIMDLFAENRNEARSSILPSGNGYAALRTDRWLAPSEALEELMRGITQIQLLEDLEKRAGEHLAELLQAVFEHLRSRTLRREGLVFNSTGSRETLNESSAIARQFLGSLPQEASNAATLQDIFVRYVGADGWQHWSRVCTQALDIQSTGSPSDSVEALTLSSKVAFAALSIPGARFGSSDYAAQTLLCHSLRTGELWERIRMKGGAYGAGAAVDGSSRILTFSSYRDPNIAKTFQAFGDALRSVAQGSINENDLLLAKIGTVSKELRPLAPAEAGSISLRRWLYGSSDELRQLNRDQILATTVDGISQEAEKLAILADRGYRAVIAGPEMVDKETGLDPQFKVRRFDISPSK